MERRSAVNALFSRSIHPKFTVAIAFFLPILLFVPAAVSGQGFGINKKKVVLHRRLPAAVHLPAGTVSIKVAGINYEAQQVSELLRSTLETDILKNNKSLQIQQDDSANVMISCVITHFEEPPPQVSVRNETVYQPGQKGQKGQTLQQSRSYYTIRGALDVTFKATDLMGKTLDSGNFSAKYSREFEQNTNQATNNGMPLQELLRRSLWGGKKKGEQPEDSVAPPTQEQLRQNLVHRIAAQIAARLVNTDEPVEVFLARGKLDEANKMAESNLWNRNLESLETITPLIPPQDDAYRLYNIGVAYEALAYQSEDRGQAKKFLEQAAIYYGKAIDAKPGEKYFREPQTRIETAVAYYKKLENQEVVTGNASSASREANSGAVKRGFAAVLTNEKVIEMVKSGVDPDDVVVAIQQAPLVQFDTSPDGLIELARNGVKGKTLAAMRERERTIKTAPTPK
jgi:Plant specific mitochondrial import receptor subunit TOM20